MTVRLHFGDEDFARIRLAQTPDALWESLLSMHLLQTADASSGVVRWRHGVRQRLSPRVRELLYLAPPVGYSPDFLTPTAGEASIDMGIGALLSTPCRQLRRDTAELAAGSVPLPESLRPLADGDSAAIEHLALCIQEYFQTAVAPFWIRIQSRFAAERAAHVRLLTDLDPGRALAALHPCLSWQDPVLSVAGIGVDRDVHLDGRGLLLLPSYFCRRAPTVLKDPGLPPVVVFPMSQDGVTTGEPTFAEAGDMALESLLGRTRALILGLAAGGSTTTELARGVGVSAGTASYHAGVLRNSGLLTTRRIGSAVLHTLTPLGHAVLNERMSTA
ncbi:helix-turn-helix domain-containing protein [Streptomyces sp. RKAG337]|uniref:helix-turn-helix domain-containing protein n=1 Tax=Streptomyces sp. RKAG337 TaxID=2893404 RepID=UPI0020339518|nr:helix-turn-helix domain-containing protein [Streptomyces sp. RKAG337]MCM2424587.1 winged helix-turn-helix domain-containing protein [Streptomyces sp. RKAG337]